ncbi:uncharacterized protein MICPUCDRAFT_21760, partial [Micromonas pusilla CCMP1545]
MPRSLASMRQDPFANVFKLCGLDQMRDVTTEGDVATIVDRSLGRKVLNVNGNVPAANYFRLPKIGKPPLGLRGRFAYVQARLDPERFYAIHLDVLCVGSGDGPGKHDTGFRAGAKTVRLSLSNLYKKKGDNKPYDALGGTAFAGAAGDVDAVTGMPPLTAKGDAPASPPAGAVLTPALKLERVIGLSGEHAGAVCWAPEGSSVAYPCGGVVVVSDALTGKQSHLFGHTEDVHLLTFSKDGRYLATGQRGRHPTVRLWDFETMNCVATMQAHASGLSSVDVSPDGRALVAAGMDTQGRQLIAVWDISKTPHGGAAPMVLRHRTDYHVNCVRFSPFEEDHLVTCGKNSIRAYRLRKGQLRGCSVSLGDLKLSKMMSGEAAAATDKTQKKKRPVDERLL